MKQILHLQVVADLDQLDTIEPALATLGEKANWDAGLIYQVQLVLEELTVNTASYGFNADDDANDANKDHKATQGIIEISISEDDDSIRIDYSDNGKAFDPFHEAPQPDLESDLMERSVGGLGVHFVRTMMDEVSYKREANRNHICLVKKRTT